VVERPRAFVGYGQASAEGSEALTNSSPTLVRRTRRLASGLIEGIRSLVKSIRSLVKSIRGLADATEALVVLPCCSRRNGVGVGNAVERIVAPGKQPTAAARGTGRQQTQHQGRHPERAGTAHGVVIPTW
jgi:hypothetical protein